MHAWEQIQQTIDYIEEHLDQELDIENLAKMVCLSPFYYQRLFSRLVKKPVAEYVKLRRMAKATEALLQKDKRILDVALDLGFTSHQHFSRAFKETFGVTPDDYRKNPKAFNRMTKPQLMMHYTLIEEGVPLITEGIVLEINKRQLAEPMSFVGLEAKAPVQFVEGLGTESGDDPLEALWRNFHQMKEANEGFDQDAEEIGVALPSTEEGYFCYFAGAKPKSGKRIEGFTHWQLPQGEYIVCSLEAEDFESLVMDALYKAQQYIYRTWLPKYKVETEAFCAERYANHSADTVGMEIWLKIAK